MSNGGDDMIQKRVFDALVSGGLKEEQLKLIADDPEIAQEVAGMVRAALDRRRVQSVPSKDREPPKSGDSGIGNFFW